MTISDSSESILQTTLLKKRILSGGAWALSGKVVTAITGLIMSALLARILEPQDMGAYFILISVVTVAAVAAQSGLHQAIVKLMAEAIGTHQHARASAVISTVAQLSLIAIFIVTVMILAGPGEWIASRIFGSPLIISSIGASAGLVIAMALQNIIAGAFRGLHDIRLATFFGGVLSGVLTTLVFSVVWLTHNQPHLKNVILLYAAAMGVTILVAGIAFRIRISEFYRKSSERPYKDVLRLAGPILLTDITLIALSQSTIWILGAYRPQEEVAVYGAALRLIILVSMPLLIINAVVPPIIAEMYSQKKMELLERALRATTTIAAIPGILVVIGFIFWGKYVLSSVFGDYYGSGATILTLLSLGQLINVWTGSCGLTLMMSGHQTTMMAITIICGVLTVLGALFVVREYAATGVAAVAASGLALQNVLMLIYAKMKTGIWTHMQLSLPSFWRRSSP